MDNKAASPVMHSFSDSPASSAGIGKKVVILLVIVLLGVGTGYLLSKNKTASSLLPAGGGNTSGSSVTVGKTYGSNDESLFKDSTEGTLKEGGIDGEGQYHLVRPGGDSQNVYLTSSTVDLSLFLNHKVKVWGQTQAAQKAGWLMDVGRVQVLE
jgi:hypothetical protein